MTTIATDGRSIAADGRATHNDVISCSRRVKLHRLPDGSVVGGAGRADVVQRAVAELMADPSGMPTWDIAEEATLLRIYPSGEVVRYSSSCLPLPVDTPAAIGSGCEFAIGAMLMGADPATAVRIAAKCDTGTGGRIKTIQLRP